MRAYVGVTDGRWYRFLAARPELNEINFWRPGGGNAFRALQPGEPFFFKSHYPQNQIVGGGFYSGFVPMRVSEAWELLGPGNGAPSLAELRDQIGQYRKAPIRTGEDPDIGCLLLRDVRFFPDTAAPPPGFAANIVQGKGYDLADSAVASYFGELFPPVLQAAHVRPVTEGGEHRLDNGLLLRSDVHTMFDRGYLGVDPKYRLVVSPRLREEFGNGQQFYAKAGQVIELPARRADRPNREFLEWHLDEVFKAS